MQRPSGTLRSTPLHLTSPSSSVSIELDERHPSDVAITAAHLKRGGRMWDDTTGVQQWAVCTRSSVWYGRAWWTHSTRATWGYHTEQHYRAVLSKASSCDYDAAQQWIWRQHKQYRVASRAMHKVLEEVRARGGAREVTEAA